MKIELFFFQGSGKSIPSFLLLRCEVTLVVQSLSQSDSLWPHGLQHARLPCPSPSPGVCSDSCPLSWWCHPIISSSIAPFSSCPQSFPISGCFPVSPHQEAKALEFSFSISPSNGYSGLISFKIDWLDLLAVQGTLQISNSPNPTDFLWKVLLLFQVS